MLTAEQCRVVACLTDGGLICYECAEDEHGEGWEFAEKTRPVIEYEAESEFPDGLWCDECGKEIVSPYLCDCETPKKPNSKWDEDHCGHCDGLLSEEQKAELGGENGRGTVEEN